MLKCPVEGWSCSSRRLARHLVSRNHAWSADKSRLTQSYRTSVFNHLTKVGKNMVSSSLKHVHVSVV